MLSSHFGLKLAGPLFRPALNYDLFIGVEIDGVMALGVEVAKEATFPAGEGKVGHRRSDAEVDADVAGGGLVAELARGGAAGCEEAGHIAVGLLIYELDG